MLRVVPDKRDWLTHHKLDVAIVVLSPPFLRPSLQAARIFRLFRLLRLLRLVTLLRGLLTLEGVGYAALLVALTVIGGGAAFAAVETDQNLSTWDGIWWAVTTVTTVGYADIPTTTNEGRAIAITVMLVGLAFVALLTAAIAERFIHRVEQEESHHDERVLAELREIRQRLERLEGRR